jgi:hypothetical protein
MNMNSQGVTVEHDLKGLAIGQVLLDYKGQHCPPGMEKLTIECEVYEVDGVLSVHSVCPKCRHSQWINGKNKKIEYDKGAGTLHVERFACPWEMGGDDDHHAFGFGLCQLALAFDGKVAREV